MHDTLTAIRRARRTTVINARRRNTSASARQLPLLETQQEVHISVTEAQIRERLAWIYGGDTSRVPVQLEVHKPHIPSRHFTWPESFKPSLPDRMLRWGARHNVGILALRESVKPPGLPFRVIAAIRSYREHMRLTSVAPEPEIIEAPSHEVSEPKERFWKKPRARQILAGVGGVAVAALALAGSSLADNKDASPVSGLAEAAASVEVDTSTLDFTFAEKQLPDTSTKALGADAESMTLTISLDKALYVR